MITVCVKLNENTNQVWNTIEFSTGAVKRTYELNNMSTGQRMFVHDFFEVFHEEVKDIKNIILTIENASVYLKELYGKSDKLD